MAAFQQVLDDPDIPSERRRQEEVHLLAVSFLNSRQLTAFNTWSTERRKRIKAREQQLHHLSRRARNALKRLALADEGSIEQRHQAQELPVNIQHELRSFARRRLKDNKQQSNSSS
uniref:Uncharacterized protein n=1 Tax=Ditylenchus dipsaci TaxID=166011 RepID=A0A915EC36_9BILA